MKKVNVLSCGADIFKALFWKWAAFFANAIKAKLAAFAAKRDGAMKCFLNNTLPPLQPTKKGKHNRVNQDRIPHNRCHFL